MRRLRLFLYTGAAAAVIVGGTMVITTSPASADVACNRYGECWHVNDHYTYPPNIGVRVYGDDWRDAHRHDKHYHWLHDRDNDRGYYSHGRWHALD